MTATLRQQLDSAASAIARQQLLAVGLQQQIAKIAGVEPSQIELQQQLSYLGFDSLMATELRNYLLTAQLADISLPAILAAATVGSLIEQVQAQLMPTANGTTSAATVPTVQPATLLNGQTGRYPLSQGQWGLWFLYKLAPESAAYNIAFTARIRSHLDMPALQQAVRILVERHPTLRTTYGQDGAEPFQAIHPADRFADESLCEQVDASGWDEVALRRGAIAAYQQPFDLESGPVLRVTVLTQAEHHHILLFTIHHIAVDGVSFGILLNELQQLYPAAHTGQAITLPPIQHPYTDFVQWQRELVHSSVGKALWDYWQQQLREVSTLILPADHAPAFSQGHRGASYSFEIAPTLTAQLRDLAKAHGATLYTLSLTAFQVLLYRYTGQTDLVVGTPASGRSETQFAQTVGFFVNMIALRTNLTGKLPFTVLLAKVRRTVLEALEHQSYPAPILVEKLGLNRDLSLPGLFRASFNLLNLPKLASDFELSVANQIDAETRWGDLVLMPFEIPQQEGQNDLVFDLMETSDRLIGIFRYSCDLFEASTIERMAGHFQTLLSGIVAQPDCPIAQLPWLTAAEQQQVLNWQGPIKPYPTELCVHQLIEQQAAQTPEAIAIVCPQMDMSTDDITYQQLTYRQLNAQANQLACYLQQHGIGCESRVGIYLERSPALCIALLAVLKAGGAYVPLDPNYPPERLAYMLSDAQAVLLLTDSSLLETLPQSDVLTVCLDQLTTLPPESPPLTATTTANHLAYIVYTSGSTGQAKGVMVEHRNVVNAYFAWEDAYKLPTLTSHLQMASFSFDVFAGDFVRALGSGAKLVICPQDWLLEPQQMYALMVAQAVDAAEFGPAVVRTLMQYLHQTHQTLDFMGLLIVGSDAFYLQEYEQLKQLCGPHTRVINSYGVSEATIDSSYFETTHIELATDGMVPIGRPFPNTRLWILDSHLQPVPIGIPGELYISGPGITRGYLNRPELTAERFLEARSQELGVRSQELGVRSQELEARSQELGVRETKNQKPKTKNQKSILYKTGDLARYLPDGNLEYLGRSDSQVKLRGFRIELGEIEATLGLHPAVRQGVVLVREDRLGIKTLVAYVVCGPEQSVTPAELRTFLSQKLPAPMVPSGFMQLEAFPLNANGKVDRRSLPLPTVFERGLAAGAVVPRNGIEKQLAAIWVELLQLDRVGVDDNFFELGGHSLLATQAIAQIRQAFQIELPLRVLFDQPTIALLGEQIESSYHQQQLASQPAIVPAQHEGNISLSFAQESLWFLNQLEAIGPTYHMPIPLRLRGRLNIVALEQSLLALSERHTILRTVFPTVETQPVQMITAASSLSLPIVDVADLPAIAQDLEQLIFAEAKQPFDLAQGPLMRLRLLRWAEEDHVLIITLHHIIADGWSIEIFARELGAFYRAYVENRPTSLPELPIQYADFAHWQRQFLQGTVLESLLAHWQRTLAGAPPVLSLPTDHPRPPVQTFNGSSDRFWIDAELTQKLQSLAQQTKVTLFMLLLAVFQVLLRGYTGEDDIVVGAPVANRNRAETAGLIGYFVNVLVLRTDLSGNPTFREVLQRVYEVAMDAYTYQDLPFEKLVEALQPERSLSHTPLFQVMFVLQNTPTPELQLPDLTIEGLELDVITSKFDLTLALQERGDRLEGFVEYNTNLFEPATIQRLMGHYQQLLKAVVAAPEQLLSSLCLLTPPEQVQQQQWQQTQVAYPQDQCIHQLFEAQVERTPEAVALISGDQQLTYRQLNERANQLGYYLQAQGVGPEMRVGICLDKSLELLIAVLGVLKAGGAYMPVDPNYPAERIQFMLEDTQATWLLTHSDLMAALPDANIPVFCCDRDWPLLDTTTKANLNSPVAPHHLAYIIYTSGSTGQAKGVMVEHHSLVNAYFAWQDVYNLRTLTSHLQVASFSFDVFTGDWVRSLCSGAQLVLCPQTWLLDPERLYELMRSQRVEAAEFSPPVLRQLIRYLQATNQTLAFIKLLIVGSDSVYWHDYTTLKPLCAPTTRIINSYGLSEATIDSTYFELTDIHPSTAAPDGPIPIGLPFPNTQIFLLNRDYQPVPIGIIGELYISGPGIARGYLNREALTAERFLKGRRQKAEGPFILHPLSFTLYRTGDLARYRSDGTLELVGRSDSQIKLHGVRIELGEIEAVLTQSPLVSEAVVMLRGDEKADEQLVAYVVAAQPQDGELKVAQVRTFLQKQLPGYVVPSHFIALEALPLSPNGKIDRQSLPIPDVFQRSVDAGLVAPRDRLEQRLKDIWLAVLQVDTAGVHDNFFELGGHSLQATQVITQVRQALGVELPLRALFESPTIAQMAELIQASCEQQIKAVPAIIPTEHKGDIPLSFAQESLWFLNQLEAIGPTYHMPMPLRLRGRLDVAALEQSLLALSERHAILRTAFPTAGAQPVQVVTTASSLSLPVVDVASLSEANRDLEPLIFAEAKRPFDLSQGPLMRLRLLRCAAEDHVLVITLHHIIADGWSIEIFARELGALYSAVVEHRPPALPELPIQYADVACWQRQFLQGAVLESLLAHWQRTLAGAPPMLSLPTDFPRPPVQTFNGSSDRFWVDAELTQALQALAQQAQVTLFMLLLAVFQILLRSYSGEDDIVVGAPVANRNRAETAGLIGYFVNVLVLRTDLSGNPTFREVLQRVYEVAMDAYTYQDLPFEKLVEALQPERSLSHTPLFQVMFVLQNTPTPELQLPDLTIEGLELDVITSKFDLTLALQERGDRLEGFVEYNTNLFEPATIQRLMGHYQQLLKAVVAAPEQSLSSLCLLTPEEQVQQQQWQQTQVAYPQDQCIHQLFEAQVERTPEAVALISGNQQLTYHQLNERANQLGHYLQTQGIGPEVRVGICLDKSPELLVTVLGVLKAGGTYVPLDPTYPADRLQFMLEDVQIALLITHSNLLTTLPKVPAALVLDQQWAIVIAPCAATNPLSTVKPQNLSYIVYTSGSTGRAKGVMVAHHSLVNAYFAWQDAYTLQTLTSHLQVASFSFDVFTGDWVRALCSGAQLVLCPRDYLLEPHRLYALMQAAAIDTAEFSPAVIRPLVQYLHHTQQTLDFMRLLIVGSDTVYVEDYHQLQTLCSAATRIINSYGVSEATIDSSYFDASQQPLPPDGPLPIGHPFPNTQLHILDPNQQPVPIGIPGELYISGPGVARGYWQRPTLTSDRFLPNPFGRGVGEWESGRVEERETKNEKRKTKNEEPIQNSKFKIQNSELSYPPTLYKTGDRARYRPDGTVELLGRLDNQVKLRGFRIEVGEIETVLTQFAGVHAAVVMLRQDLASGEQLVAYVVADAGGSEATAAPAANLPNTTADLMSAKLDISELRAFVKSQLPGYMVPAYFVVLAQLPISANGKVDRRMLPLPEQTRAETEAGFVVPSTPTAMKLAAIWEAILERSPIGVEDNFFDLGGHSLLATALLFKIQQAFDVECPLRYLFDAPTIAALAPLIDSLQTEAQPSLPPIRPRQQPASEPVPLSLSQQYIWSMHQADTTGAGLNSSMALQFSGELDPNWVEHSFNQIIDRHEILRTTFVEVNNVPLQQVLPELPISLIYRDLQSWPREKRKAEAVNLGISIGQQPFDLTTGPLLRVALFRLQPQLSWLLITMHHIITDGWSFGGVLQELDSLLPAHQNPSPSLPEVALQYADFALWQRQVYNEAVITQQLAYWQHQLVETAVGTSALPVPAGAIAHHYFTRFPASLRDAIAAGSQTHRVTPFVILLAGLKLALAEWSQQSEILVVATVGNRTVPETQGMLGCFINDVIVRSQLAANDTGSTFLQRLQTTVNDAIDHKEVPLQRVIEQTKQARSLNLLASITMTPSVQTDTASNWQPLDLQPEAAEWEAVPTSLYTIGTTETTPLELYVELATTVRFVVSYSPELFTRNEIEHLFARYQTLLEALLVQPDKPLRDEWGRWGNG